MRVFDHPNNSGKWECPVCKTDEDRPVVLIMIHGQKGKRTVEAIQVHYDCIELTYDSEDQIFYQCLK